MRRAALVALALVLACSADAMTSHMLLDAGKLARDAAQLLDAAADAMGDAGESIPADAQAQAGAETHDVACTAEYLYTTTTGSTLVESWLYFAELALDTGSITGIDARTCGRTVLGAEDLALESCSAGSTCTGTRPPVAPCAVGTTAIGLETSKARVLCGQRLRLTQAGVVTRDAGYRYATVRLTVRR